MRDKQETKELSTTIEKQGYFRKVGHSGFVRGVFVGIATVFVSLGVISFVSTNQPITARQLEPAAKIREIFSILETHFVGELDNDVLMDTMFTGLLYGVGDPYTSYMNRDALARFLENTEGRYAGVGIRVQPDFESNRIQVLQVFTGGPSYGSGLEPGDQILQVNGIEVFAEQQEEAVAMIRGTPGTSVNITLYRSFTNSTFDVDIVRADVEVPTVEHRMIDNEIGFIRISNFDRVTYQQFMDALNALEAGGMRGLVLDVRNNPGGLLDTVVRITNELVPSGLIVYTENRHGEREEMHGNDRQVDIPLVVLVNEHSASASEVLAGAVRDTGSGVLVGARTFGKGVVQSLFPLSDGSGIKVTVATYYTPNGISINGEGILPDVVVEKDRETSLRITTLEQWQDQQLMTALDVVRAAVAAN